MTGRLLVACEFSGVVRDAFRAAGYDATSCDLTPSDTPGPHYVGDVRDILGDGWHAMIAHPPCTYLAKAGVRWLHTDAERWEKMIDGAVFIRDLLTAPIPHIAVENPVMHRYAARIIGKQTQVVQPWQFGHLETKATALWLRNLPPLRTTANVRDQLAGLPEREVQRTFYMGPSADRGRQRSITYAGIADAMVAQWGRLVDHAG